MKRLIFFIIALALLSTTTARAATVITQFDLNHYEGWNYTRPGVTLNATYISNLAQGVRLYHTSTGLDYTLVSPAFSCTGTEAVLVNLDWVAPTYDEPKYSLTKSSPTVELLDLSGNVVAQKTSLLPEAKLEHQLSVKLTVPTGTSQVKLRLACWTADVNSPGLVKAVTVTKFENIKGDINADGKLDVGDVTALVEMLLDGTAKEQMSLTDLDADGRVDVGDVTSLVNLLLR